MDLRHLLNPSKSKPLQTSVQNPTTEPAPTPVESPLTIADRVGREAKKFEGLWKRTTLDSFEATPKWLKPSQRARLRKIDRNAGAELFLSSDGLPRKEQAGDLSLAGVSAGTKRGTDEDEEHPSKRFKPIEQPRTGLSAVAPPPLAIPPASVVFTIAPTRQGRAKSGVSSTSRRCARCWATQVH